MSTTTPAAPGQLGTAARPAEVLAYLGELERWLVERRAELDSLDAQILATGRQRELTTDMALAMALWQAAKSRQQQLLSTWDSGRVGQQELDRLSALIWGRLDATAESGQLASLSVSLPEAGRLCDALVAQLRERLDTDPAIEAQQIRLRTARAQLERIRDQIGLEPPSLAPAATARLANLGTRLDELTDKRGRGGDIAGLLGTLEQDAARFERDLIVGAAQRREARELLQRIREHHARAASNQRALAALAADLAASVSPAPALGVPDLAALGPIPNTAVALARFAADLDAYERRLDEVHRELSRAQGELAALQAQLPALRAKATALNLAAEPSLVELDELIERRLAEKPVAAAVVQQLLAGYTAQLGFLERGRR